MFSDSQAVVLIVSFIYQEERYEKLIVSLQGIIQGKGEKELNDALSTTVAKEFNLCLFNFQDFRR